MQKELPNLDAIRAHEFPLALRQTYLDNAGRGLLPRSNVEAAQGVLHAMSNEVTLGNSELLLDTTRERAARLLNCGAEAIALLSTTSQGLNLVPGGLDWRSGDEVILYEADHPTDIYAWLNLSDRGVVSRFVSDRDGRYEAEDVERLIGPRTRAVCLSLVNYGTGFRAPIEAIGEICRRRGVWLVVDAIMGMGALRVDAPVIGADLLVAHGYKFLLSGFGVAICYCSPRARTELRVAEVGYKGMEVVKNYVVRSPDFASMAGRKLDFAASARRFEAGTQALSVVAGMRATLDLMLSAGVDVIDSHIRGLARQLVEGLRAAGCVVAGSAQESERSAIVSFTRPGVEFTELSRRLTERGIHHHVIHQRIRLSPHFYNNRDDIAATFAALAD